MKICDITYDQARERHPSAASAIVERLRTGTSKCKDMPAELLKWRYDVSVEIDPFMMVPNSASDVDKVADLLSRTFLTLYAKTGSRWWSNELVPREEFPPEVLVWAKRYVSR